MTLCFSIPTWNRADQLRVCIESIAQQINGRDVYIKVQDNASTDHTQKVLKELSEKYSFISYYSVPYGRHVDYSESFRMLFESAIGDWTWTFGDDDVLLPGSLDNIQDALSRDFEFIHVAERKRATGTGQLHNASLLDMCNKYGLLDMTGFITGNIVKTKWLHEAALLPSWPIYAKSAFVQSLALLEVLKDQNIAFIDWPMVDSQDAEQNEETQRRWTLEDTPTRYFYLIDGLEDMKQRGVLDKVNSSFFRYLSYFLWDRFIQNIVSSYTTTQDFKVTDMLADLIDRTVRLTALLPAQEAKRYRQEIIDVRDALEAYSFCISKTFEAQAEVDRLLNAHGVERFAFSYLLPKEMEAKAIRRDNNFGGM